MADFFGYRVRPVQDEDIPFIYNSFLRSFQRTFPYSLISDREYFSTLHDVMEYFLSSTDVFVAVNVHDEKQIFGWVVGSGDLVVYLYVKYVARGFEVGENLLEAINVRSPVATPFLTAAGRALADKLGLKTSIFLIDIKEVQDALRKQEKEGPREEAEVEIGPITGL